MINVVADPSSSNLLVLKEKSSRTKLDFVVIIFYEFLSQLTQLEAN